MTINISLSTESIAAAIRQLRTVEENIRWGLSETIDILVKEGAQIAQAADGKMATVIGQKDDELSGKIIATGEAPIIAEFGAGYATMDFHPFAKNAPVPIEPGSYSRENFDSIHGGWFYITDMIHPGEGYWYFGGEEFDRIQPRHGLLDAHDHIVSHAAEIAKEVIKL